MQSRGRRMIIQPLSLYDFGSLRKGREAFLLLDSGRDSNLLKNLYAENSDVQLAPLLPVAQFGDASFSGPLLVSMDPQLAFLRYFLTDPNNGIIIFSKFDITTVSEHCSDLLVQSVKNDSIFFRFYDPRVILSFIKLIDINTEISFFSHIINTIIIQVDQDNMISLTPQGIIPENAQPRFKLTEEIAIALEADHSRRKFVMLSQNFDELFPSYARLPQESKDQFLKQAQMQATIFGIHDFDVFKTFCPEWFLCKDIFQKSKTSMAIMSDIKYSISQKLSYIYNFRLFNGNRSSFHVDPVNILARDDLYAYFPDRVDPEGNRTPINLFDASDTLARMYYAKAYRTYEEIQDQIYNIAEKLFREKFAILNKEYDIYKRNNIIIESQFCLSVKKELGHD
jgi:hypothetical protein